MDYYCPFSATVMLSFINEFPFIIVYMIILSRAVPNESKRQLNVRMYV